MQSLYLLLPKNNEQCMRQLIENKRSCVKLYYVCGRGITRNDMSSKE